MYLLHTTTHNLKEFQGSKIPPYAILSHTWGDEEVLFSHMTSGGKADKLRGWKKVSGCCEVAANDGWEWVWIETCCIDKQSSAELSEAINSMYQWYRQAAICYVFLEDVSGFENFGDCKWFRRGWTLQELLAPRWTSFYNNLWVEIGTQKSLEAEITAATGIQTEHLYAPELASVAQKMSWAARRETTKLEDQAYSLLGIFDVNMPILYGEGPNAFTRLQEAILTKTCDDSIFAWRDDEEYIGQSCGLLAPSPRHFLTSGNIIKCETSPSLPVSVTSIGLSLSILYIPTYKLPTSMLVDSDPFPFYVSEEGDFSEINMILGCINSTNGARCVLWLRQWPRDRALALQGNRIAHVNRASRVHRWKLGLLLPHNFDALKSFRRDDFYIQAFSDLSLHEIHPKVRIDGRICLRRKSTYHDELPFVHAETGIAFSPTSELQHQLDHVTGDIDQRVAYGLFHRPTSLLILLSLDFNKWSSADLLELKLFIHKCLPTGGATQLTRIKSHKERRSPDILIKLLDRAEIRLTPTRFLWIGIKLDGKADKPSPSSSSSSPAAPTYGVIIDFELSDVSRFNVPGFSSRSSHPKEQYLDLVGHRSFQPLVNSKPVTIHAIHQSSIL